MIIEITNKECGLALGRYDLCDMSANTLISKGQARAVVVKEDTAPKKEPEETVKPIANPRGRGRSKS